MRVGDGAAAAFVRWGRTTASRACVAALPNITLAIDRAATKRGLALQDAVRALGTAICRRGRCDGEATDRCGCHVTRGTDGARGDELALIWPGPLPEQK